MSGQQNTKKPFDPRDFSSLPEDATGIDRVLAKGGEWISWLFFIIVLITAYEVFMRYLFNSPTMWVHETTVFLVSFAFLYSCAYTSARNSHIRITIIYDKLPARWRRKLDIFTQLLMFVYFTIGIYAAYILAKPAVMKYESSGSGWNPHFPPYSKSFMCIMFALLAVQALARLRGTLKNKKNQEEATDGH